MKETTTTSRKSAKSNPKHLPVTVDGFEASLNKSFDELFNVDEKKAAKMEKEAEFNSNRQAKQIQLVGKISELSQVIVDTQKTYRKSLIDPLSDSVKLLVKLEVLQKEKQLATKLLKQLFPKAVVVEG